MGMTSEVLEAVTRKNPNKIATTKQKPITQNRSEEEVFIWFPL
jgi:hypothetical protein